MNAKYTKDFMKTYIELKQKVYFKELNKQAKTRFISSICEEIGADGKYVIKLLNGSIKRGNGKKGRTIQQSTANNQQSTNRSTRAQGNLLKSY